MATAAFICVGVDAPDISYCSVEDCHSPARTKGLCTKHYQRKRAYGSATAPTVREARKVERAHREEERRQRWQQSLGQAKSRTPRECYACGQMFMRRGRGKSDALKFCSRECGLDWRTIRSIASKPVKVTVLKDRCKACDKRFTSNGWNIYCSDDCKPKVRRAEIEDVPCSVCGTIHPSKKYTHNVCQPCRDERQRLAKERAKHAEKASGRKAAARKARKLRLRGVAVESVNPLTVLERDKWTCQLCGVKTPKRLRGTYDDRAPEVDHIIPIAQGGEHSYRNTQCACRKCNLMKSGTAMGQMRLFG